MDNNFPWNRIDRPNFGPRVTEIRRVGPTEQVGVTVIGSKVHGFGLHWDNGQTAVCIIPREECPRCKAKVPWKWNGYLHVYEDVAHEHYFIEMTEFAFDRLLRIQGERETLRGLMLLVWRERKTIRSPLMFSSKGECSAHKIANVKERTPEATLKKLWKL